MAVIDIQHLYDNDTIQYQLNNMDDVMKIAEKYPSMRKKLASCSDMNSIAQTILKYFNSHSGMHAKLVGKVKEADLYKSEMSFQDRFDAWLQERGDNQKLYDTGWNADPGDKRKPEKKQGWLKSLFNKVGYHEN